jgi:hypothetical protein
LLAGADRPPAPTSGEGAPEPTPIGQPA